MLFQDYIYQSHTISPAAQAEKYIRMHVEEIAQRGTVILPLSPLGGSLSLLTYMGSKCARLSSFSKKKSRDKHLSLRKYSHSLCLK